MLISNRADARQFVTGGRATFTLRSTVTNTRYTYKVTASKTSPHFFASVLSGPNNGDDYQYIGFIPGNDHGKLVAGNKGKPDAPSFAALAWALRRLAVVTEGEALTEGLPIGLEFYHEGRCCRCGRRLTTPESIERGVGPECAKKE